MYRVIPVLLITITVATSAMANESITEALNNGKASVDLRLRYESVEQDNAVEDAGALTLRTHLGYSSGSYKGFSAKLEMEDVRIAGGQGDYTVGPTGYNPGQYSVIADPEHTELDQGYLQYKTDSIQTKLGRQVLTYDNHRFVGHVGWRQDRQTFDGVSIKATPLKSLTVNYSYLTQRNRIFAEEADVESKDHLLNLSYKTPVGKLTGYAYMLTVDNNTDNALDTIGFSLNGGKDLSYHVEIADQTSETVASEFDSSYLFAELATKFSGMTAKLGHEILGSDDGNYGFSTPLATLHKFNGWSDQFLGTPAAGLVDTYLSLGGKVAGGKWLLSYHDFSADESSATLSDLGSEIDLLFAKKLSKTYSTGIKYASYSAGDAAASKVDTDKLWVWFSVKI